MALDELPSTVPIVVLAVVWDEVEGPTIISKAPADGLADPVSIALQIYLSSVAVFGQHGSTKRIDFTLPLLSISPNHVVNVAFDSWPDSEVRGDERTFYLGFIMNRETEKLISEFLSTNIWKFMDNLKDLKSSFDANSVYVELIENLQINKPVKDIIQTELADIEPDYTHIQALRDLETSSELWSRYRDPTVISTVLKTINRLKDVDDLATGNAYFLAGTIYFHIGDYEKALEGYNDASNRFKSVDDLQNSAESLFNSAIAAYRLSRYDLAKKNLLISAEFIEDTARKARMYLYLAQTQYRLENYDSSSHSFEVAIENAIKADDTEFVGQILSVYASKLQERAQTSDQITASLKNTLQNLSAKQRQRAAEYFIKKEMYEDAGTSLVLASKTYQMLELDEEAIETLERASDTFLKGLNYSSGARALIDALALYKNLKDIHFSGFMEITDRIVDIVGNISEKNERNSLLLRVYREKAKSLETNGDYIESRSIYELALIEGKNVDSSPELLSLTVAFANFLFQLEDYQIAGDLFHQSYLIMNNRSSQAQRQRLLKNSNLSYKRAFTAYLQASNIFLHKKNYNLALELYSNSIRLVKLVKITSHSNDLAENTKWIDQNLKSLKQKKFAFPKEDQEKFANNLQELD